MNLFDLLAINKLPPLLKKRGHFAVDDNIGASLLISLLIKNDKSKFLIVTSNIYKAQKVYSLIKQFTGLEVALYPCEELVRAEHLSASKELVSQRLFTLDKIINNDARIVITNLASTVRYLPSLEKFKEKTLHLEKGKTYNLEKIKETLIKSGYVRVNKIDQSLQFASRGDILDIFSVNMNNPVRIEFFGDEIESIREFDMVSQTSINKIEQITILPGSELILSDEEIAASSDILLDQLEKDKEHLSMEIFDRLRFQVGELCYKINNFGLEESEYKYYSKLTKDHHSLFDYCKDYTNIFVDIEGLEQSNDLLQSESFSYLNELHENGTVLSHLSMYQNVHDLVQFSNGISTSNFISSIRDIVVSVKPVPYQADRDEGAINIIQTYLNEGYKVVICLNKNEYINTIEEALIKLNLRYENVTGYNLPDGNIGIAISSLSDGFVLQDEQVVYLTSQELFNEKGKATRFINSFKSATILKTYEELNPGDYVVHEYQGIGQFIELQTIEVDGRHDNFLKIAYANNEILYVPLSNFQLVRKYLGKEGSAPRLSHLHSKDWENTKRKIKERVNELANRLMNLYLQRNKIQGFSFKQDDEFQRIFENHFAFPLTEDQEKAINEIKKDMEANIPMDRLLCGDVGFGKTEVAFRAAFKAINSGKQVAILCPTTLLARQHYELANERFAGFDIKIAIFSRLIPESKQKIFIKEIKEGKIHLIIGTHRLLNNEITYKDLGLLIVDEEQRFGVEQKEKIKEMKTNIDVLSLSATPIPRTLQISLLGVRSMSLINTPPLDRMPIQTYVAPFKLEVVKELIERELGRNGQVFYMHNSIDTLYMCANRLQKMLPNICIGVAHGKMNKEDIEDVMLRFYKGEIDVLVCTTIIENGIDVPNANMIIVEDSENYGLSQLYQIKGRVGRSNRIAYAYLFYSGYKKLTQKAQKRLKAIQDFTKLGSGFKIAQRDLMIRGAGDILGPEQAGFIDSIGLEMYIKLLNESIKEKMEGSNKQQEEKLSPLSLSIDAYIPEKYASDPDKIELYQDILSCPNQETLSSIKAKTRDIYGKLPKEVELLFLKKSLEILKDDANLESIKEEKKFLEIVLGKNYINIKGIGNLLFETLIPYLKVIKVSYVNNKFKIVLNKRENWLVDLENILKSLVNLQHNYGGIIKI